ncbi:MAG: glycerophosphodiester phosphodiesterase family protein [Roseovarius sp.]
MRNLPQAPLPELFRRVPLAHRGLHAAAAGRPENSRAAIAAAIAAGYGIEIDLQLSRDGQAVVFHDARLERMTAASGPVRLRDMADLGRIALRGSGEAIPALVEVLALIAGRVPLLVEMKDQHGRLGPTDGALEQAVAEAIAGYAGPLAVMSFNPHMVRRLGELAPSVPRGIVSCAFAAADWRELDSAARARLRAIPDYAAHGCSFISHEAADLGRARVGALKARGAAILCWTVRSPEQEARARRIADNITFEGYLPAIPPRS